jgi:hypothetical protein
MVIAQIHRVSLLGATDDPNEVVGNGQGDFCPRPAQAPDIRSAHLRLPAPAGAPPQAAGRLGRVLTLGV